MSLRTIAVIFLLFTLISCSNTSSSSTTLKNIEVLDTVIDYTSVDDYPLFSNCSELDDKQAQKSCFEATLTKLLSEKLHQIDYQVKETVNDSSYVELLINSNGKTKVIAINSPQSITQNLPELDSIIRQSINELPIVDLPAKKRDIPVNSQYRLAVVVRTLR